MSLGIVGFQVLEIWVSSGSKYPNSGALGPKVHTKYPNSRASGPKLHTLKGSWAPKTLLLFGYVDPLGRGVTLNPKP